MGQNFEPKYLTPEMAQAAVRHVVNALLESKSFGDLLKRKDCSVVVLVPQWITDSDDDSGVMRPLAICQENFGNRKRWQYPFDEIARSKALQRWYDRNDERTDIQPHLLMSGDAPFWGGTKMEGLVVTCSGFQPWLDKMVSRMVAAMCIGFAYEAWQRSEEKAEGLCKVP